MDPLTAAKTCHDLITTIGKISKQINGFVRQVRDARQDLDAVSRELHSLQNTLEILSDDGDDQQKQAALPPNLVAQISGILSNCGVVLAQIQAALDKYSGGGLRKGMKWSISGREDMDKLRSSLEAHKSALGLTVDFATHLLSRETNLNTLTLLDDTAIIKGDTSLIKGDTAVLKEDNAQILSEIVKLQARLAPEADSSTGYTLQRYLDNLSSYAESSYDVLDRVDDWERSHDDLRGYVETTSGNRIIQESGLSVVEEQNEVLSEENQAVELSIANQQTAPELPDGWKAYYSDEHGEWFYANTYTEETQWDIPLERAHTFKALIRNREPPDPYKPALIIVGTEQIADSFGHQEQSPSSPLQNALRSGFGNLSNGSTKKELEKSFEIELDKIKHERDMLRSGWDAEKASSTDQLERLREDMKHLQNKHQAELEAKIRSVSPEMEAAQERSKDLEGRLYAQNERLNSVLETLGFIVTFQETGMAVERASKSSVTLADGTVVSTASPSQDDVAERFNLDTFSEVITKRNKDLEYTARKFQAEARTYRDKLYRVQSDVNRRIAFRNFKAGDLALFLPTRNQVTKPWAAFNVGAPHYFLKDNASLKLSNRDYLVARITKIEERIVDLSIVTDKSSDEDTNPYDLSDGLRWYLLEAIEDIGETPSASVKSGLQTTALTE